MTILTTVAMLFMAATCWWTTHVWKQHYTKDIQLAAKLDAISRKLDTLENSLLISNDEVKKKIREDILSVAEVQRSFTSFQSKIVEVDEKVEKLLTPKPRKPKKISP